MSSVSLFVLLRLGRVVGTVFRGLLVGRLAADGALQGVPHAAHEDGAEEVLERQERVVDAEQDGRQPEVDEEDGHSEVDDGVRRLNQPLPLQQKHDRRRHTALGYAAEKTRKAVNG